MKILIGLLLALQLGTASALDAVLGKALFERLWVSAPASTDSADGLGPLYNARACASCHPRAGRGRITVNADGSVNEPALVMHLSGDSVYGQQIQTSAIPGQAAEAQLELAYRPLEFVLADGTRVLLQQPEYRLRELAYGDLPPTVALLPRLAPALPGLGLIARIPAAEIVRLADPADADGDGISGRVNWRPLPSGKALGRFGWKAESVSLESQTARALLLDMGLSSPLLQQHAGDCSEHQIRCINAPDGASERTGGTEISNEMLRLLVRYLASLKAPAEATLTDTFQPGGQVFSQIGCDRCHRPTFTLEDRTIRPYSDFLLHDLGPALADPVGTLGATGAEWRTAPLWGIGQALQSGAGLLHDGRAASLTEAILWHDGEARTARDGFAALDSRQRQTLLDFLSQL